MGSLVVDFLLTKLPLQEIINIFCDTLFKKANTYESSSKSEFKTPLSLVSKECCFFFNEVLYKQKDGVPIGSHFGLTLADAFLSHYEKFLLDCSSQEIKALFYRKYVHYIFVLFDLRINS